MLFVSTVLHIWFRSKFDFKNLSTFLIGSFLIGISFLSKMSTFSESSFIVESVEKKEKFSDNPGHNILELQCFSTGPRRYK